ncbi:MAG: pyridoxal-dependent decarboxylase, partial [Planctomycetota bacterium]
AVFDYRDWQIPLGRRFRALKLWFVIRHYGIEGLQHHVREHVRLAREFAEVNQRLMDDLNQSGRLYLTHTRLDEKLTLRLAVGQTNTQQRHVEQAWALIRETAPKPN